LREDLENGVERKASEGGREEGDNALYTFPQMREKGGDDILSIAE